MRWPLEPWSLNLFEKYDILAVCGATNSLLSTPGPSLCWSSLKSSSVPPPPPSSPVSPPPTQNQVISPQAGPHFTPRVCLSGLDGVVAVAYVSLLGGQRCKGGRGVEEESVKNTVGEIRTGVKWTAGRAKNPLSCKFSQLHVPWS